MTVFVLLVGISILLVGHGVVGTLLGVRATIEHFSNAQTGLVMASYYAGFIVGTWSGLDFIRRVGHIRTFTALAALCATTTLLFGLLPNLWNLAAAAFPERRLRGGTLYGGRKLAE
jgi:MFS family permease